MYVLPHTLCHTRIESSTRAMPFSYDIRSHPLRLCASLPLLFCAADTEKMFEKDAYSKTKPKCFSSGAAAPDACENPGGSKNDPRINPWAGNKAAAAPVQVAAAPKPPAGRSAASTAKHF